MEKKLKKIFDPHLIKESYSRIRLPQLIEKHKDPKLPLSEEYFRLLCNWIKKLERRHFGKFKQNKDKLERRLDVAIMFIQFSRENKDNDVPLLMLKWRFLTPNWICYFQLKEQGIAFPDRGSVYKTLLSSEIKRAIEIRKILTYSRKNGVNIEKTWADSRKRLNLSHKEKALLNFRNNLDKYYQVYATLFSMEKGKNNDEL